MTDHYQTLGITKTSDQADIKRAFRNLASKNHPDKGGDTAKFQEIQNAYAILSDPEKKSQYDNPAPQGFNQFGGMPPGFEDIFAQFGSGTPFGDMFGRRPQPARNRTLNLQTQISLEEAYSGKDLIASIQLPSGRSQLLEVKIPAGVNDGTVIRLAGIGDDTISGVPKGDIHLSVHVAPHDLYQRIGDDLKRTLTITCFDAILGTVVTFDTIDHRTLEITIAPGTQYGQILAVQGYGMPNMHNQIMRARLLIEIHISIPKDLADAQKNLIKQIIS